MKISEFDDAKKIADIIKDKDTQNHLKIEYEEGVKIKKDKTTYAKVVDGEVVNIFESSNFKANQQRYYESTESTTKAGDKASDTNYAKFSLAKENLDEGKKVEIYELTGDKKENLEKYYQEEDKYPLENFQMNGEKIPEKILEQKKKDMEEYEKSKKK